jgi:histone H3/H4
MLFSAESLKTLDVSLARLSHEVKERALAFAKADGREQVNECDIRAAIGDISVYLLDWLDRQQ